MTIPAGAEGPGVGGAAGRTEAAATTWTFISFFASLLSANCPLAQRPWNGPLSSELFSQEAMEWVGAGRGAVGGHGLVGGVSGGLGRV